MISTFFSTTLLAMLGGTEMILIAIVLLLMFGGKKIPELMRGIGKGIREFKEAKENKAPEIAKDEETTSGNTVNTTSGM